ncbi:hypothetical protein [Runella salmonicolor]|uniref:Uncharacterized protein n=1 Tax=Runella salmonicolor TaxID=2950278 RepID=A0ABT1FUM4_9BACT|nr:hypothetical protein [Runella salmonicolor]MCP1384478.1 hypothetical protein [Runella salmonicolor]
MINVTQRGTEWLALVNMAKVLVLSPQDRVIVLSKEDEIILSDTLTKVVDALPDGLIKHTTVSVLLLPHEVVVLVQVVDWFDDYMLSMSKWYCHLKNYKLMYEQVGLVKRNLKLYATPYTTAETKNSGHDDTH